MSSTSNRPDVTDAQRDEMLAEAHRLTAEGMDVAPALRQAAKRYGVSEWMLRRWASKRGQPVHRAVPDPAKTALAATGAAVLRAYTLEDTRALAHRVHGFVEQLVDDIAQKMQDAQTADDRLGLLPDLGRASTVLTRVATLDERLDRRGAGEATSDDSAGEQDELERIAAESVEAFTVMRGGKA